MSDQNARESLAIDDDIFAGYRWLQEHHPVTRGYFGRRVWTVTRYDDIAEVLTSPHFSADRIVNQGPGARFDAGEFVGAPTMLTRDAPEHTRLRSLAGRALAKQVSSHGTRLIDQTVNFLLAPLVTNATVDLVREFARPFPMLVIAGLLGVATDNLSSFLRWSSDIVLTLNPACTSADYARAADSYGHLRHHITNSIEQRHHAPTNDLISDLIAARWRGEGLSDSEIADMCVFLMIAGNETTSSLISSALRLLMAHPEQLDRVSKQRRLIPNVVEEVLRVESPVQATSRRAIGDIQLSGKQLRRNDTVIAVIAAGNRDPRHWDNSQSFNIHRTTNSHLSFGWGSHYCLGAPLARQEAIAAIESMLEPLSRFEITQSSLSSRGAPVLRSLEALAVKARQL